MGRRIHGMRNERIYGTWRSMKQRCHTKTHKAYNNYGGRGIKVCSEWLNSFSAFYADMGTCPAGLSLDRIDNNKGYYKENCKWSTWEEQQFNKRKDERNKTGVTGIWWNAKDRLWAVTIGRTYIASHKDFFEACCLRKSAENKRANRA